MVFQPSSFRHLYQLCEKRTTKKFQDGLYVINQPSFFAVVKVKGKYRGKLAVYLYFGLAFHRHGAYFMEKYKRYTTNTNNIIHWQQLSTYICTQKFLFG